MPYLWPFPIQMYVIPFFQFFSIYNTLICTKKLMILKLIARYFKKRKKKKLPAEFHANRDFFARISGKNPVRGTVSAKKGKKKRLIVRIIGGITGIIGRNFEQCSKELSVKMRAYSAEAYRPAKTSTCVLDINHQNVTSKFGTRSELAFEDSFSIEWVSLLSKELQVSSNVSGQLILALRESSSHGG